MFDVSIDITLTFELEHNITIKKIAIFTDANYIDIQPALVYCTSPQKKAGREIAVDWTTAMKTQSIGFV